MNKFKMLNNFLAKETPFNLLVINKIFKFAIPFNRPHDLKIKKITKGLVETTIPMKTKNHNHLRSMHACAIATIGEFSAGLLLIKNFSPEKYRLILSELNCKYLYQGKSELIAHATLSESDRQAAILESKSKDNFLVTIKTKVKDKKDNLVAEVTSTWQLKEWEKVKTKT